MGKLYRINPFCQYCGEEHMYWTIGLTDEEQKQLDEFEKLHEGEAFLVKFFAGPGVIIKRRLKCGCCKKEFDTEYGLREMDALDYEDPDMIKMGRYTL